MRKITLASLILILLFSSPVQAIKWEYSFVVWKGNIYEVMEEEEIVVSEIGKKIGEVKTWPNEMTGNFYGNASNVFSVGTSYYEVLGIPSSKAIAIKGESGFTKALYKGKAPFHIMNILTNPVFISLIGLALVIIMYNILTSSKTILSIMKRIGTFLRLTKK